MEDIYAVIDMKSFYASCECAERGLDPFCTPLVVADPDRSLNTIVMSCTPFLKEKYHCPNVCRISELPPIPDLIIAKPRMRYYLEQSARIVSIFLDFISEEDLHVYSVDESFLRLTPYLSLYRCTAEDIVRRIQCRIQKELRMTATAGLGPNMFLAKVCLDNEGKKKPPFLARWGKEDVETKLWAIHPITKIWGISNGISSHLSRLGIHSLRSLAHADDAMLKKEFGIIGKQLKDLANGIDESKINEKYVPKEKSLSIGQTLMKDYSVKGATLVLREMNDDLCYRLRSKHLMATRIGIYCQYAQNGGFSRQCSLDIPSNDTDLLFAAVLSLFYRFVENEPIRGLGIHFQVTEASTTSQGSLFESVEEQIQRMRLDQAKDHINQKYGKNAVLRATSLTKNSTIRERHLQIGGHHA